MKQNYDKRKNRTIIRACKSQWCIWTKKPLSISTRAGMQSLISNFSKCLSHPILGPNQPSVRSENFCIATCTQFFQERIVMQRSFIAPLPPPSQPSITHKPLHCSVACANELHLLRANGRLKGTIEEAETKKESSMHSPNAAQQMTIKVGGEGRRRWPHSV